MFLWILWLDNKWNIKSKQELHIWWLQQKSEKPIADLRERLKILAHIYFSSLKDAVSLRRTHEWTYANKKLGRLKDQQLATDSLMKRL